jgi:hypothetical protein
MIQRIQYKPCFKLGIYQKITHLFFNSLTFQERAARKLIPRFVGKKGGIPIRKKGHVHDRKWVFQLLISIVIGNLINKAVNNNYEG